MLQKILNYLPDRWIAYLDRFITDGTPFADHWCYCGNQGWQKVRCQFPDAPGRLHYVEVCAKRGGDCAPRPSTAF